jgi:hypothetical protein
MNCTHQLQPFTACNGTYSLCTTVTCFRLFSVASSTALVMHLQYRLVTVQSMELTGSSLSIIRCIPSLAWRTKYSHKSAVRAGRKGGWGEWTNEPQNEYRTSTVDFPWVANRKLLKQIQGYSINNCSFPKVHIFCQGGRCNSSPLLPKNLVTPLRLVTYFDREWTHVSQIPTAVLMATWWCTVFVIIIDVSLLCSL